MERQRTVAQDAAKGLMIIGVIFFHCMLVVSPNPQDTLNTFNVLTAIFPFLLSTFFFYAGYNYQPSDKTFKQLVIKRAKQLLIPLVVCFVVSTVIISSMELIANHDDIGATFHAIGNTLLYSLMSEPLAQMIHFPQEGGVLIELVIALGLLWFLYALFICSIFFYLLVHHTNRKLRHLISVVVGLLFVGFCLGQFVGIYLPYHVQVYPVILAIMLTGAYLRKSHFLNRWAKNRKKTFFIFLNMFVSEGLIIAICFAAHFMFGAVLTGSIPGGMFDPVLRGFDAFIAYAFGILGTYFIHTFCRILKHVPVVSNIFEWIGMHSAIFYLFHPIFISIFSILVFKRQVPWGMGQAYFYAVVTVIGLTLLGLLLDYIANKKKGHKEEAIARQNAKAPEDIQYEDD